MCDRWKPKNKEKYWYVNTFNEVKYAIWAERKVYRKLFNSGNCFKTEEEAEAVAEKVKALMLSSHDPVTCSNQLPKLTTDVFNRPDCPEWAKWAAVDMNGIAHYFDEKPYPMDTFFYNSRAHHWMVDGDFDASDWQNSLIERTVDYLPKLTAEVFDRPDCPEWAKYAAVDAACLAHWYQYPPTADERAGAWSCLNNKRKVIDQYFNRSNWKNSLIKRPSKDLLKLTTDVFNHPDCPEWANWAAVDKTGCAYYYSDSPVCKSAYWEYDYNQPASRYEHRCEIGMFDSSDWKNSLIERPANDLPKLTIDVFDHPECPKWARYAAVDQGGNAFFHAEKPIINCCHWMCNYSGSKYIGKFDSSDWRNSLIERPAKSLPDWCKVGELVYYIPFAKYCKIEQMDSGFMLRFANGDSTAIPIQDVCNLAQAKPRPYNEYELRGLVGKVVTNEEGNDYLCTAFNRATDNSVAVVDIDTWVCAEYMLEHGYTIDGKQCGVLEHFEKGEWVE